MDIGKFSRLPDHILKKPVLDMIWHKYRNTPRHRQVELGPSQIGEPCTRKLAYSIMHHREINTDGDPLPSIIGTAAHSWLQEACNEWNEHVGRVEWIAEAALNVAAGIVGHCDAYHVPTHNVIDWKFPGASAMQRAKANGASDLYKKQAHLYGKAWYDLGLPVNDVAVIFFPRGGLLSGAYFWSEPFSVDVANTALRRYWEISELTVALQLDTQPQNYQLLSTVTGHSCTYCLWFRPGPDTGDGCPGYTAM